jgi:hypothetical protein
MISSELKSGTIVKNNQPCFPLAAGSVPDLENCMLQQAVRENLVSFPSQVPVFERQSRPDLQPRLVILYFVRGWTMDAIAERYGLGRQRIGQILTAWRIRATKEGYIQEIDSEHQLFKKALLQQAGRSAEVPAGGTSALNLSVAESPRIAALPVAPPSAPTSAVAETPTGRPIGRALTASGLAEELHTIVCVLDNQLRFCAKPLNRNIDSCEYLLARATALCALLEARVADPGNHDEWPIAAAVSSANALFRRFQEYTEQRSTISFQSVFASAGRMSHTTGSTAVCGGPS